MLLLTLTLGFLGYLKMDCCEGKSPPLAVIDPVHTELRWTGLFLAAHKYFDVDRRRGNSLGWKYDPRVYHKHFPVPRLKRLHSRVSDACHQGAMACVREIAGVASKSYSISDTEPELKKKMPNNTKPFYPLASDLEFFRYRTTATYFMCWYSMMHDELLMNHMGKNPCLQGLEKVKEKSWADLEVTDFRKGSSSNPWLCAEIQFCPDPCYGRKTGGSVPSHIAMRDDKGNPCKHLKDKTCKWIPEQNTDLESLQRNRFNISCQCYKEKPGFKWSSRFKICVDIDECSETSIECEEDRICQNTVGSFECLCRMGSRYDAKKRLCAEFVPLPAHSFHRSSRVKAVKQKTALMRFTEYIFGLRKDSKP